MTTDSESILEHHGVKGMKWGVRRTDGGSIPRGAYKSMVKRENRFQNKREKANAQVMADRQAGVISPKHQARATKLNTQHRKNEAALREMGLEVYKNFPSEVKKAKVSDIKTSRHLTRGQKATRIILTGPIVGVALIRRAEGRSALTGHPKP